METLEPSTEEHKEVFAEELIKHVLLKDFGIHWESDLQGENSPKLALSDFYTSCVLLSEAVTNAWRKYYAAIDEEANRIFKSLDIDANTEKIYCGLKEIMSRLILPADYVFFIVMAVFGDLCVRICRSGAESLISNAVSAAKRLIVEEGLACKKDLQVNSVNFMEFIDAEETLEP